MDNNVVKSDITIPIMHCFDNNYVVPAAVSFYSMLENANKDYNYRLFVLHNDITVQNQVKLSQVVQSFSNASLEFINMDNSFEDIWRGFQNVGHFSKEVLYKLLAPSIFPEYEKIIITDVDVVFLGDISESYFSFESGEKVFFAGVHHICPKHSWLENYYENYEENFGKGSIEQLKVCGGYLVANLVQLRQYNKEDFIKFLEKHSYRLLQAEQDVINFCCKQEEIRYLPLNYVVCSYQYGLYSDWRERDFDLFYSREEIQDAMNHPIQLHYAADIKPWKNPTSSKADIWFYYLSKCGMFYDYMVKEKALRIKEPEFISNADIRNNAAENRSPIIVSVICCTYNHEQFIRETLEGLVNQKVDFPFEIIVSDDASVDATQNIIEEYCVKYPDLIVPILREKNIGIGENYYDALCHVKGRFLAICDGDDCWIDRFKLKKQVEFLQCSLEYNVCCSSCMRKNIESGNEVLYNPEEYIKDAIGVKDFYDFKDLLYCRFAASCTVMMRWQLRDRIPEFLSKYDVIDFPLILIHAAGGRVKVMADEVFARYNIHDQGITSIQKNTVERESLHIINEVNQFLGYRFSQTVSAYMLDYKQYMEQGMKGNGILEEAGETKIHVCKRNFFYILYIECVPEILKRVWRVFKKAIVLLYMECVPNILKRVYRMAKRKCFKRNVDK